MTTGSTGAHWLDRRYGLDRRNGLDRCEGEK